MRNLESKQQYSIQNEQTIRKFLEAQKFDAIVEKAKTDIFARNLLGLCYLFGIHTKKDEERAFAWFKRSTSYDAINNLGVCHLLGLGTKADPVEAFKLFEPSRGRGMMLMHRALCWEEGLGTSIERAWKVFELYQTIASRSSSTERHLFQTISDTDIPDSQFSFAAGNYLEYGRGVAVDEEQAYLHYFNGIILQRLELQYPRHLSICVMDSSRIKDEKSVFQWFKNAADKNKNNTHASAVMFFCYHMGIGVDKDSKEAVTYLASVRPLIEKYKRGVKSTLNLYYVMLYHFQQKLLSSKSLAAFFRFKSFLPTVYDWSFLLNFLFGNKAKNYEADLERMQQATIYKRYDSINRITYLLNFYEQKLTLLESKDLAQNFSQDLKATQETESMQITLQLATSAHEIDSDSTVAVDLFKEVADLGIVKAQVRVAELLMARSLDEKMGLEYLERAAANNSMLACEYLADYHLTKTTPPNSTEKLLKYLETGAELSSLYCHLHLAQYYRDTNKKKSDRHYLFAAALVTQKKYGEIVNRPKIKIYDRAHKQNGEPYFELASIFEKANYVPQAIQLFELAAGHGHTKAIDKLDSSIIKKLEASDALEDQVEAARCRLKGIVTLKNEEQALAQLRKFSEKSATACEILASYFINNDLAESKWTPELLNTLKSGAALNSPYCHLLLAQCYKNSDQAGFKSKSQEHYRHAAKLANSEEYNKTLEQYWDKRSALKIETQDEIMKQKSEFYSVMCRLFENEPTGVSQANNFFRLSNEVLATYYLMPMGRERPHRDLSEAKKYLMSGAKQASIFCNRELGNLYREEGVPQTACLHYKEAVIEAQKQGVHFLLELKEKDNDPNHWDSLHCYWLADFFESFHHLSLSAFPNPMSRNEFFYTLFPLAVKFYFYASQNGHEVGAIQKLITFKIAREKGIPSGTIIGNHEVAYHWGLFYMTGKLENFSENKDEKLTIDCDYQKAFTYFCTAVEYKPDYVPALNAREKLRALMATIQEQKTVPPQTLAYQQPEQKEQKMLLLQQQPSSKPEQKTVPPQQPSSSTVSSFVSLQLFILNTNNEISPQVRYLLMMHIASTLEHMHSQKILSENLCSLNIIINESFYRNITDSNAEVSLPEPVLFKNDSIEASAAWKAPEVLLDDENITVQSNIYTLGILFWEILTRQKPFDGMKQMQIGTQVTAVDKRPALPEKCPPIIKNLIELCWAKNPETRHTAKKVVSILQDQKAEIKEELKALASK